MLYRFQKALLVPNTNIYVKGISTLTNPDNATLLFCQKKYEPMLKKLRGLKNCCVFIDTNIEIPQELSKYNFFLKCKNPRLTFTRTYQQLANIDLSNVSLPEYRNVNGSFLGNNVQLGHRVTLEPGCLIDHEVEIGDDTVIRSGAKIRRRVVIGHNCLIKENAVIGSSGFNFERGEDGSLLGTPQLGGVIINNYVEIGAFCTVASGTIDPTVIHNQVKLNDHVHIAHNVQIDECTIINAAATISGSTRIGKNVWIGPNCAIMNQITIGDGVVVGISARVHKSVASGTTVINEGADTMDRVLEFIKFKKEILINKQEHSLEDIGPGHPLFK